MSYDKSIAYTTNYIMSIERAPDVTYFCQTAAIPSVSIESLDLPMGRAVYKEVGGDMQFSDLNLTFLIDENYKNYLEVYNWMLELRNPQAGNPSQENFKTSSDIKCDVTVSILSNNKNPLMRVHYRDAWPRELSEIQFDITDTAMTPLVCDLTLAYSYFEVETLL